MERMIECKAAVAGFLIGLGVIINTLAADPVLGAFLFSFGLLTIIDLGIPLYTGQIGFISEKKKTDLIKILIFNIFGILGCILFFGMKDPTFFNIIANKATIKFNKDFLTGTEHCIADAPYWISNLTLTNSLKFLLIIMGNSLGAIFIENMLKKKGKQLK